MSTFESAPELQRSITISWAMLLGLITSAIAVTFFVTSFYLTATTIEQRMDKRHQRTNAALTEFDKRINTLEQNHK